MYGLLQNWDFRQKAQPVGYVYPFDYPGNNYYCESGNVGTYEQVYYLTDPLWDGSGYTYGNGCRAQIDMPWFYRKLPVCVAEDIEVCIWKTENHTNEEIAIEELEIFVI